MLYILALEPFLHKLRVNPALLGATITLRYSAYVDDVSVLVTSSAKSKEIGKYVGESGAKGNHWSSG